MKKLMFGIWLLAAGVLAVGAVNAEQTVIHEVIYVLDAESKTATAVGLVGGGERMLAIPKEFWYEKTKYTAIAVAPGAFRGECAFSKVNVEDVKDVGEESFAGCLRLNQVGAINVGRFGKSAFEG